VEVREVGVTGGGEENGVVAPTVFIVRARRDATGRLTGVVERVATGEKARFQGSASLADLIQQMLPRPRESPRGQAPEG
jgi:hypothetical protein